MTRFIVLLTILSLLFISAEALYSSFPDNTIPTLAMRIRGSNVSIKDITLELLCELSWLNFDAVNFAGLASSTNFQNLMSLCDSVGIYYSICPREVMQYLKAWEASAMYRYWFRNSDESLTSEDCFAKSNAGFDDIEEYTSAVLMHEGEDYSIITTVVDELAESTDGHDFLWFYEVYDEANSQQGKHVADDPNSLPWNDYIPNVYTQDRKLGAREMLSFEEVETSGIFSWQKYLAENNNQNEVTFTLNFALIHFIDQDDYTGLIEDRGWGDMDDQATCVRAMMEAEYQYPPPDDDSLDANAPEFIMLDYYPFRQVHPDSALAGSGAATMCDDDWLFLIDHFEEGIDSTVIPAHEYNRSVYYFPQTFGVAGGPVLFDTSGTLAYPSYLHRKPASQEFRMLCNLALLHQAKGIFPYNICSYTAPDNNPSRIMSSLLDLHNIPFDAPYEEWVYTGRWPDSTFEYVRPDNLPPWIAGYDPLYTLPAPPPLSVPPDPKYDENWYTWLFEPHGLLYNDIGGILADVKWIGPEMHDLWWCNDTISDGADISYDSNSIPADLIAPVIKVFEDNAQETCYLFYVDRYCLSNNNPYEITFNPGDLPNHADCSIRLLDHSRRFIMDGTFDAQDTVYTFLDTLDAGEGRLVQLVDLHEYLPADVRITSSNVRIPQASDTLVHLETTVGDSVIILADFYNMGTQSRNNVIVTLFDSTVGNLIGRDTLEFDGLAFRPSSACRACDLSIASFGWTPDSTDIGVHRLTVTAATWPGEPDSDDNSVDFAFLVNPRDYATEVRGVAWDMTEGGNNDWHTDDIEAVALNWDTLTGWTDSVSGMFEGMMNLHIASNDFRGSISLAIPEDSTEYIDTDKYHMLSFGIVGINPEYPNRLKACVMRIGWRDDEDTWHTWEDPLTNTAFSIGNGWDEWCTIGPIDLKGITDFDWGDYDASELWLRFQSGNPDSLENPDPIHIRIGWVRLEESAP